MVFAPRGLPPPSGGIVSQHLFGRSRPVRTALVLTAATALLFTAAACGDDDDGASSSGETTASTSSEPIALLLPESKTARYEAHDRPEFVAAYKELCPNSEVLYSNANQDAAKQLEQAEAALTNGAKVLVLDPVDSASAGTIVSKARAQGVNVVSYDRLITGTAPDSYVSYDNEKVGQLQGEALLEGLGTEGGKKTIVMINGSPTDNNATLFKKGAHSVLDGKVTIGREYDTTDWSPDVAQQEMEQAITALGKNSIDGVLAANDGTAGGAIAAMKAAGFAPIPPITGQDAELAGIQRIVSGDQYMTIYKGTKDETQVAAQFACAALNGTEATTTPAATDVDGVPTVLLDPVVVTKDNIKDTVIADGYWTVEDICTKQYAEACKSAGLT
jgi:D-xylose transport system substrate-binding protein